MNYKILIPALLLVALLGDSVNGGSTTVVENTVVASGAGKGASVLAQILGSVADVWKDIDIKDVPVRTFQEIGTNQKIEIVAADKKVEVQLPQAPGEKILYEVTFTKGETPNAKIKVLLMNLPERPGMPMKKMEVKFLRHLPEEPDKSWTEVGNFGTSKDFKGKIGNAQVTLKSDGTAVWTNPVTKKDTVFLVSKKKLDEEKA